MKAMWRECLRVRIDHRVSVPRARTGRTRRAVGASLLCLSSVASPAATPPPELIARATGAAEAPVHLFLSDAPLETVLRLAAEAADLELELAQPLPGTLSGTIDGTLGDVLRTVAERAPALYDIEADLLEVRPVSARAEARLGLDGNENAVTHIVQDPLDRRLPGNTVEVDGAELLVAGHPAFVARTLAEARAALPSEPAPAPAPAPAPRASSFEPAVVRDAVSDAVSDARPDGEAHPTAEPTGPRGPLDGLDDIPGFNTY